MWIFFYLLTTIKTNQKIRKKGRNWSIKHFEWIDSNKITKNEYMNTINDFIRFLYNRIELYFNLSNGYYTFIPVFKLNVYEISLFMYNVHTKSKNSIKNTQTHTHTHTTTDTVHVWELLPRVKNVKLFFKKHSQIVELLRLYNGCNSKTYLELLSFKTRKKNTHTTQHTTETRMRRRWRKLMTNYMNKSSILIIICILWCFFLKQKKTFCNNECQTVNCLQNTLIYWIKIGNFILKFSHVSRSLSLFL